MKVSGIKNTNSEYLCIIWYKVYNSIKILYVTKVIFIELFQGLTLSKKLQICFGNIGTILDRLLYLAIFHTRHIL